jgi:ABC-type uncharacterized transport system fused permease/ATPase subunit
MKVISALMKIFSIGTIVAGPFIAILLEAVFAEILIILLDINPVSYYLTPVFLLIYTILHLFISQGLLFGDDIFTIYLMKFQKRAEILHIGLYHLIWMVLLYAGIHIVLGLMSGWLTYSLSRKVEEELTGYADKIGIQS